MHSGFFSAETIVALALAIGILAEVMARHLRVPGIVLMLGFGVLLGPDVAGVIRPNVLGDGLMMLVGFAVAVILFEGGMNLNLGRLRRENRAIRRLVTLGAVVTALGGALAARVVMGMPWVTAFLFGTLVIVTGPTVITPLLRRFSVERQTATVLEAEGVLIDAVGAVIAIVALEVAFTPTGVGLALGMVSIPLTLGGGGVLGAVGGFLISLTLGVRNVVPEGLHNVLTLALVLALYQVSNSLLPESGIAAVTAAGVVVGNRRVQIERDVRAFKEQLTVLFIGLLFVLLAADVRITEVTALGWPGVLTVLLLMFVVRPLNVLVSTAGTELSLRQRLFISAIGPRGIVAAAVAAFFAAELQRAGVEGGERLRALVFLVIVVTVVVAGVTGGALARLLGLARPRNSGYVILGANPLARSLAHALVRGGEDVMCIDTNPEACDAAQRERVRVLYGNGMSETMVARAEIDTRKGAIGLTPNTEVNLLFIQRVAKEAHLPQLAVAARRERESSTRSLLQRVDGKLVFGGTAPLELWSVRVDRGTARPARYRAVRRLPPDGERHVFENAPDGTLLPLTKQSGSLTTPVVEGFWLRPGDIVEMLINQERTEAAETYLRERGFEPVQEGAPVSG